MAFNSDVQSIQTNLMNAGYKLADGADGHFGPGVKSVLGLAVTKYFGRIKADPEYNELVAALSTDGALDAKKLGAMLNDEKLMETQMSYGSTTDGKATIYNLMVKVSNDVDQLRNVHKNLTMLGLYSGSVDGLEGTRTEQSIKTLVTRALAADKDNQDFFEKDGAGAVILYDEKGKVAATGKPKIVYPGIDDLQDKTTPLGKLYVDELKKITTLQSQAETMATFGDQYKVDVDQVMVNGVPSPELVAKSKLFFDHIREASSKGAFTSPLQTDTQVAQELISGDLGYIKRAEELATQRDAVVTAQKELKARGFYKGEVNGVFNPATNEALYEYAKSDYSEETLKESFSIPANGKGATFIGGVETLVKADNKFLIDLTNESVRRDSYITIQTLLHDVHDAQGKPFYTGGLDGVPGPKTAAALNEYSNTLSETTTPKKSEILALMDPEKPGTFKSDAELATVFVKDGALQKQLQQGKEEQFNVRLLQEYLSKTHIAMKDGKPALDTDGNVVEDPKGAILYKGPTNGIWNEDLKKASESLGHTTGAAGLETTDSDGSKTTSSLLDYAVSRLNAKRIPELKKQFVELGLFTPAPHDKDGLSSAYQTDVKTGKSFSDVLDKFMKDHHSQWTTDNANELSVKDTEFEKMSKTVSDEIHHHRETAKQQAQQADKNKLGLNDKALESLDELRAQQAKAMQPFLSQQAQDAVRLAKLNKKPDGHNGPG